MVALPEHTATALYGLVGILGTELATGRELDRLIFTTRTGKPWARTNVHTALTRLATKAGISKPISSHVLRHTHATLALELGVPLHHLQDSPGHADPPHHPPLRPLPETPSKLQRTHRWTTLRLETLSGS